MSAILASYVKMSTLVDGTMRVVLDIEPVAAADAFALLGSPGTPIALARLTSEAAQKAAPPTRERKALTLPQKVALTCQERSFQQFLASAQANAWIRGQQTARADEDLRVARTNMAAEAIKILCSVTTRADILPGTHAAEVWSTLEADYLHWQRRAA